MREALDAYQGAGARLLVSLLPDHELRSLGLQSLAAECEQRALPWVHCPIEDFSPPGEEFERCWNAVKRQVHSALDKGEGVALHCRAGIGRTGTIAARILIERGVPVQQAIICVRQTRPGSIETASQEAYLKRLTVSFASLDSGATTLNGGATK